jgi:hypothetical protein
LQEYARKRKAGMPTTARIQPLREKEFVQDEDLQTELAERDAKLYLSGVRLKKKYISRNYEIPEDEFDMDGASGAEGGAGNFTRGGCGCGCGEKSASKFTSMFQSLFASKPEKRERKARKLMAEFSGLVTGKGQEAIDGTVEAYADALGGVENYEDAAEALAAVYDSRTVFAAAVDEARFAARRQCGALPRLPLYCLLCFGRKGKYGVWHPLSYGRVARVNKSSLPSSPASARRTC